MVRAPAGRRGRQTTAWIAPADRSIAQRRRRCRRPLRAGASWVATQQALGPAPAQGLLSRRLSRCCGAQGHSTALLHTVGRPAPLHPAPTLRVGPADCSCLRRAQAPRARQPPQDRLLGLVPCRPGLRQPGPQPGHVECAGILLAWGRQRRRGRARRSGRASVRRGGDGRGHSPCGSLFCRCIYTKRWYQDTQEQERKKSCIEWIRACHLAASFTRRKEHHTGQYTGFAPSFASLSPCHPGQPASPVKECPSVTPLIYSCRCRRRRCCCCY